MNKQIMIKFTETDSWKAIQKHFKKIKNKRITDFFDDNRMDDFSFDFHQIYFDFSKHRWDKKLLDLMTDMTTEMHLQQAIDDMFSGKIINLTEQRAVLHTALRQQDETPVYVDKNNVIPLIKTANQKIKDFTDSVISGKWKGISGKSITDIVNIGIGGSDLGPKMVVNALSDYRNHLKIHYLSNIDPFSLDNILNKINLETTLFVIVSKSFSTQETLTNAKSIQQLYISRFGKKSISKHFVTVSTKIDKAREFGIHQDNIFPMWDWVGGRFSLWSPAGISIPLAIGYESFEKLLQGAFLMDKHFKQTDFNKNIPVLAAFLTIIYNNLYQFETEAYIPYAEKLKYLPDFLQQLLMESNGKSTGLDGDFVNEQTGNIIWGNVGTNAQHSFFQLLHQGTKTIPVSFIAEKMNGKTQFDKNHLILLSNMIAQSEALMTGDKNTITYKNFEGNRPSTTILFDEINPLSLGSLIAYYEHKTFVEAWLWQINAFDQFGVELGKRLAKNILNDLQHPDSIKSHDHSTLHLIKKIIT
jgi:glucose-6-phosphate isomerase